MRKSVEQTPINVGRNLIRIDGEMKNNEIPQNIDKIFSQHYIFL